MGDLPAPTDDTAWLLNLVRFLSDRDVERCEGTDEINENVADLQRAERIIRSVAAAVGGDPEPIDVSSGAFIETVGGDLPKPDERGFSMWFDREQWGAIMDGLIAELDISRKRKVRNSESTSDIRAQMCSDLIGRIGSVAAAVGDDQPGHTDAEWRRLLTETEDALDINSDAYNEAAKKLDAIRLLAEAAQVSLPNNGYTGVSWRRVLEILDGGDLPKPDERRAALADLEQVMTLTLQAMAANSHCPDADDPDWRDPAVAQFRRDLIALGVTDAELDAAGISSSGVLPEQSQPTEEQR